MKEMSERQREILRLAAEGYTAQEIGREVHLAIGTIKAHLAAIRKYMKARNITHAVARAYLTGELALHTHVTVLESEAP